MMQLTAAMVGMLGGPGLQVLVVLTIEREWRSLGFLQDMTNLSEKTVHQAVRKLRTLGYISEQTQEREKYYRLNGTAVQLPFGTQQETPIGITQTVEDVADEFVDEFVSPLQGSQGSDDVFRKFCGSALNESMNQSNIDINQDDSLIDDDDRKIYGDDGEDLDEPEAVTEAALLGFGFYGRGVRDLLEIRGLTLAEVKYQVENAPGLGAALARLKKRQPLPRQERTGGSERAQYVSGKFAEFIKH